MTLRASTAHTMQYALYMTPCACYTMQALHASHIYKHHTTHETHYIHCMEQSAYITPCKYYTHQTICIVCNIVYRLCHAVTIFIVYNTVHTLCHTLHNTQCNIHCTYFSVDIMSCKTLHTIQYILHLIQCIHLAMPTHTINTHHIQDTPISYHASTAHAIQYTLYAIQCVDISLCKHYIHHTIHTVYNTVRMSHCGVTNRTIHHTPHNSAHSVFMYVYMGSSCHFVVD